MSLRNKIDEDYKQSIKNKDQQKIDTLRLIRSGIKDKDIPRALMEGMYLLLSLRAVWNWLA